MDAVHWPGEAALDREWISDLLTSFVDDCLAESVTVSARDMKKILAASQRSLQRAGVVDGNVSPVRRIQPADGGRVTVIGDLHGQIHDLARVLELAGWPDDDHTLVFLGDYVDRGSWGVEVFTIVALLQIVYPNNVIPLRGNHECACMVEAYGFAEEVRAKYDAFMMDLFCNCFSVLPLGAVIAGATFCCHGGLWRHSFTDRRLAIGTIADLEAVRRAEWQHPDPADNQAEDLLWSDPTRGPGMRTNQIRGCGLLTGPDVTQAFLKANNLRLILRAHEGPDARCKDERSDFAPMDKGFTVDHEGDAGKMCTVFSAPDYPMFQEGERFNNQGAFVTLTAPTWSTPDVHSYTAAPRPPVDQCTAYYDYVNALDSDEELDRGK